MHAGHARIKRHANHVQVIAIIGNKLFFRHPTYSLDLIADPRRLFEV